MAANRIRNPGRCDERRGFDSFTLRRSVAGRLMVGRCALDAETEVRPLPGELHIL
jgi:hypothetical protein